MPLATASFGFLIDAFSTALGTAVSGASYAVPQGNAAIITWEMRADGSALSSSLEGSMDDVNWHILQSNAVATGGINNYGPTAIKFVRIAQISRTVGTVTTGRLLINRN